MLPLVTPDGPTPTPSFLPSPSPSAALRFFVTPYPPNPYYFLAYHGLYGFPHFLRASLHACVLSPTLPKYG